MKIFDKPQRSNWKEILKRPVLDLSGLRNTVQLVFDKVDEKGDQALIELTREYDKVNIDSLKVSAEEIQEAQKLVSKELKNALEVAFNNIEKFHSAQKEEVDPIETSPGVSCWRESKPIEKVGLYIPGGSAPLFSTVLMLGIPAKIAGCKEVILCTPPSPDGSVHPAILYASQLCGIKKIFKVGGAQAIAAMTIGTESIPAVDKIFGPGNQYVTAAKQQAQQLGISIDMPAGPSEVLVLADSTADPDFIAADLLSQAEHGPDSQVILVTFSMECIEKVNSALNEQLAHLPRKDLAAKSLENSRAIIVKDEKEAVDLINFYAPEHLIINVEDEGDYLDEIYNAGSVFLGMYTPESAGDYASGTNHTLPTNGFARSYSGVSLDSFVKKITYQRISKRGLQTLGHTIEVMAEAESLQAHKNAVSVRLKKINKEED